MTAEGRAAEQRVDALLAQLSLAEKLQMVDGDGDAPSAFCMAFCLSRGLSDALHPAVCRQTHPHFRPSLFPGVWCLALTLTAHLQ